MSREKEVFDAVVDLSVDELIYLAKTVNGYTNGAFDELDFNYMGDLDELMSKVTPTDLLRLVEGNDFKLSDEFFLWTDRDLRSFSRAAAAEAVKESADELVDEVLDHIDNRAFREELPSEVVEAALADEDEE